MENKTKYSILISIRADRELKNSFSWFEEQRNGLGSRFIQEFTDCIHRIKQHPEIFSTKYKSYRETSMVKFPYVSIYRINKKTA